MSVLYLYIYFLSDGFILLLAEYIYIFLHI